VISIASGIRVMIATRPVDFRKGMYGLAAVVKEHLRADPFSVERAIRPLTLNRKNALFAGSDGGAEHWAILASLIEACKLNGLDPQAYLADVFARLIGGHPVNRIDELLPWRWAQARQVKRAAWRRLR
jgi:hypothetical protein